MKFGCSLEMVNLRTQEPNRNRRESRYYWDELFRLVAAAGFKGIELPYDPYWDFGGRSGILLTEYAVKTKFGSVKAFVDMLNHVGIEKLIGLHFDPSMFCSANLDQYFGAFRHFAGQAIHFAGEAGSDSVTLSPTPDIGELLFRFGKTVDNWDAWTADFLKRTTELINTLTIEATAANIRLCVKNEFWSLTRGHLVDAFLDQLDSSVGFGVDTANLTIAGVDPCAMIHQHRGRIGSVQFTDTAFVDDHDYYRQFNPEFPAAWPQQVFRDIGEGKIDFAAARLALEDAGYQGWVACNCRQTRDVSRALLRMRYQIDHVITSVN